MIAFFLSNISAKYYKNPSMLSRVIAKNAGDVFFETQCIIIHTVQQHERIMSLTKTQTPRLFLDAFDKITCRIHIGWDKKVSCCYCEL